MRLTSDATSVAIRRLRCSRVSRDDFRASAFDASGVHSVAADKCAVCEPHPSRPSAPVRRSADALHPHPSHLYAPVLRAAHVILTERARAELLEPVHRDIAPLSSPGCIDRATPEGVIVKYEAAAMRASVALLLGRDNRGTPSRTGLFSRAEIELRVVARTDIAASPAACNSLRRSQIPPRDPTSQAFPSQHAETPVEDLVN
ncbi:hypothetical protein EWM64_g6542 [Hericium alpestre]|uniref:Uncharacterized protein n=1 Tax=Hericium alpestre TaxID=135208 RepID=A0A4Y9ZTC8_9AGAM|nr:hypothetical protein EWM64_g6542 [Hericium alpestre]